MTMTSLRNPFINWTYHSSWPYRQDLVDPRIPLVRHLAWSRSGTGFTSYSIPEPDNYNRAVITPRPWEFKDIQNQVIYRHSTGYWVTLLFLLGDEIAAWDKIAKTSAWTYWRHTKPAVVKIRRQMLEQGATRAEMSLDERLLTMGYYKNFVIKYFDGDSTIVKSRLGEARANLTDLIRDESGHEPEKI